MIRAAALTSGRNVPSARFRVRQYIRPLSERGIEVREYCPILQKYAAPLHPIVDPLWRGAKLLSRVPGILLSGSADIVWIEREFITGCATWEHLCKSPKVLDIDDAVWLHSPSGGDFSLEIAKECEGVIAGNAYIQSHYEKAGIRSWLVPTGVDTDRWKPRETAIGKDPSRFVLGWTGTSSNLPFLYDIEESLDEFLGRFPDARIKVVCDKPPQFRAIPAGKTIYEIWSPACEVAAVQGMNVGLMPLPATEWALGKCSLKLLLYMAVGVPVVASPVGTNREILERGNLGFQAISARDWHDFLVVLHGNPPLAESMGRMGRNMVLREFSTAVLSGRLADIFNEILC